MTRQNLIAASLITAVPFTASLAVLVAAAGCGRGGAVPHAVRLIDLEDEARIESFLDLGDEEALLDRVGKVLLREDFEGRSLEDLSLHEGDLVARVFRIDPSGASKASSPSRLARTDRGDHLVIGASRVLAFAARTEDGGQILCRARIRGGEAKGVDILAVELGAVPEPRALHGTESLIAVATRGIEVHYLKRLGSEDRSGFQEYRALFKAGGSGEAGSSTRALLFLLSARSSEVHLDDLEMIALPDFAARLISRGDNASPYVRQISLEKDMREAFVLSAPGALRIHLRLPERSPRFTCAAAGLDGRDTPPMMVRVTAVRGDRTLDTTAAVPGGRERDTGPWRPLLLDLDSMAGEEVELTLHARPLDKGDAGAGVAFATPVVEGLPPEGSAPPRDVILVSLDTVRADRLSCYGYPKPATPFLEELARSAAVFDRAVAPASWTLPSHVSLFTGQLPDRHGVVEQNRRIQTGGMEMIARAFRRAGYETVAVTGGGYVDPEFGFADGFERYVTLDPATPPKGWVEAQKRVPAFAEGRYNSRADVESLLRAPRRRPLFFFLHTYAAHKYLAPPADLRAVGATPGEVEDLIPGIPIGQLRKETGHLDKGELAKAIRRVRLAYDATLRVSDRLVRDVVADLKKAGRLDRTVLVVTSDHGEELYERTRVGHGSHVYEELIRVPLLICGPGIRPGRIEEVVSLADLPPTLRDLCGLSSSPFPSDGRTLLPLLRGDALPGEAAVARAGNLIRAFRAVDLKLIVKETEGRIDEILLFNLDADPGEVRNLADEQPETARRLLMALEQRIAPLLESAGAPETGVLTPEMKEELEQLGYAAGK